MLPIALLQMPSILQHPKNEKASLEHRKQVDNGKFKHSKIVNMMIDNGLLVDNTDIEGAEKLSEIAKDFPGQLNKEVDAIRKEEIEPPKAHTKRMIDLRVGLCNEQAEVLKKNRKPKMKI